MIKAIIFDLDDTLYPECEFVLSGFRCVSQYISKKYDLDGAEIFNILKKDFDIGIRQKNFNILLKKLNIEKEPLNNLIKIYREHKPKISLYNDAKMVLKDLKDNFNLGMITDGYEVTQKNKISSLNIKQYFDVVVINDLSKGLSKHSVQPFKYVLNVMNVTPEESIYVGDNPLKDFFRAKEIGMKTIRVKRFNGEYNNHNVDKKMEADYTIPDLCDILNIIKNL